MEKIQKKQKKPLWKKLQNNLSHTKAMYYCEKMKNTNLSFRPRLQFITHFCSLKIKPAKLFIHLQEITGDHKPNKLQFKDINMQKNSF